MKNIPLLVGTLFGTLALVFGVAFFLSSSSNKEYDMALVVGDSRNIKGNPSATVTVVEFSDFECPACKATVPLVDQIFEDYQDQIQLVYRHYPLHSLHPNAQLAAQAAEVAADEGKFWQYHDILFERQRIWSELTGEELLSTLGDYAQELEIDKNSFLEKIGSDNIKNRVTSDESDAMSLSLSGTPSFLVNGRKVAAPDLRSAIEDVLK